MGDASDEERERRAQHANIRQDLLAPANAIAGYAEILAEEARRLDLRQALPDIERITTAAAELQELVQRLLDAGPDSNQQGPAAGAARGHLRHDLRNPLSGIRGYGEMLLEDIEDLGGTTLRQDLENLLAESAELLARIDSIVEFSLGGPERTEAAGTLQTLARTTRPLDADDRRPGLAGTVLVIDDNASNRGLLTRRLSREGHRVIAAASGRRGLQLLEGEEIDLILLDLMMPEMDGFQVLERLKADARFHEIPVVMISGLHETDSVIRCIEAGAEDYLPKPFNSVLLRARINASLERKRWHDRERRYLARIEAEKEKSEALLRNILPGQIIGRLNNGEAVIADRVDAATVLFCDLVGFTRIASRMTPIELIHSLNSIFSEFDALTRSLGVEKIKTIGDAYMAVAGLPEVRSDHAEIAAELALGMIEALDRLNAALETPFQVRIGMHTGPVVAGIIGTHKFIYDVWGDTVNIASRLEACGSPGRIQVSEETSAALEHRYEFEPRGVVNIRGKGRATTSFLVGRKAGAVPSRMSPRVRQRQG
jgi:adenylate cyclase